MTKAPPVAPTKMDLRVQQYIQLRDKLNEMETAYENARKPIVELQTLIAGQLQDFLDKSGADSIKTSAGTAYASTRYSASLADPDAFMRFVITTENFDLLDRRANSTAVRAHVEETGALPPGVNLSALKTIGVRRPTGK